jgi:hypothetical protein
MEMQSDGLKTTAPSFAPLVNTAEPNLNRFLRLSTPVLTRKATLASLFRAVNEVYAFGFKFEYREDR